MISLRKSEVIRFLKDYPHERVIILMNPTHADDVYIVVGVHVYTEIERLKRIEEEGKPNDRGTPETPS